MRTILMLCVAWMSLANSSATLLAQTPFTDELQPVFFQQETLPPATTVPTAQPVTAVFNGGEEVDWLRSFSIGTQANSQEAPIVAGLSLSLFETETAGIGARFLFGGVFNEPLDAGLHFTGDLFAGSQFQFAGGSHWIKGGIFLDQQEGFNKFGPELGLLLLAETSNPLTVDLAFGFGSGNEKLTHDRTMLTTVADQDFQLRFGAFLSPQIQAGVTYDYAAWDDERFGNDFHGVGGFANLYLGDKIINLDLSGGDDGLRGFVNIVCLFGGPRGNGRGTVDTSAWLMQPVNRDTSLRFRSRRFPQPPPPAQAPVAPAPVVPVNRPPVAVNDLYDMQGNLVINVPAPGILANDSDPDGDTLILITTPVTPPSSGTLTLNADGSFMYQRDIFMAGSVQFVYQINDGKGGIAQATVTINFDAVELEPG